MKEFVEKLIGRLEEARQECQKLQKTTDDAYGYMKQKQGIDVAKEIVKQLAEEMGVSKMENTNADFIRKMNDEELAELFAEKCKIGKEFAMCWLQSEVKGSE